MFENENKLTFIDLQSLVCIGENLNYFQKPLGLKILGTLMVVHNLEILGLNSMVW